MKSVINRLDITNLKKDEELLNYLIETIKEDCERDEKEEDDTSFDPEDFLTSRDVYEISLSEDVRCDKTYVGEVYGHGDSETGYFYVFSKTNENNLYTKVGLIITKGVFNKLLEVKPEIIGYSFLGYYDNEMDYWTFYTDEYKKMEVFNFDLKANLFSRNEGLFESEEMLKKFAVINGCGSVGSLVTLELTKAGVGKFILIDRDIVKYHNLSRIQMDGRDLGKYKVKALKEKILLINPKAEVITYESFLENIEAKEFLNLGTNGIFISSADHRFANALGNEVAEIIGIPFVAISMWTRASSGEVFYWEPNKNMKKYKDAFKNLINKNYKRSDHYIGDEERGLVSFEPGTSIDLAFPTIVGLKVICDLLNKDSSNYTLRVLDYLTNYTLICNTNKEIIGGEKVTIFPNPLYISNSVEV